jgi:hypothetical protein
MTEEDQTPQEPNMTFPGHPAQQSDQGQERDDCGSPVSTEELLQGYGQMMHNALQQTLHTAQGLGRLAGGNEGILTGVNQGILRAQEAYLWLQNAAAGIEYQQKRAEQAERTEQPDEADDEQE